MYISQIVMCTSCQGTPSKAGVEEPCGAAFAVRSRYCREEGLVGGLGPITAGRRPSGPWSAWQPRPWGQLSQRGCPSSSAGPPGQHVGVPTATAGFDKGCLHDPEQSHETTPGVG